MTSGWGLFVRKKFTSCYSPASISIPNSVVCIGKYSFAFCESLTFLSILSSVTLIGDSAFKGSSHLTLTFSTGSPTAEYAQANGISYTYVD